MSDDDYELCRKIVGFAPANLSFYVSIREQIYVQRDLVFHNLD
jgi:hypothetical protein